MAVSAESLQLDLRPPKKWRRFVPPMLRSLIWVDSAGRYDAFLSYSWKSDSEIAPVVQSVLQKFLCPWYKVRARTVFRDLSCLPAGSSLEAELFERLDRSAHLIVLASPEAAFSHGMEMEARHWFSSPRDGQVVIIVTAGEHSTWYDLREHFVPPSVRNNLATEPLWIPLHHRRDQILTSPSSHEVRSQLIEDLKQVFLCLYPGRDWGQLHGEERAQRRRAIGFMSGLAFLFLVLAIAAVGFAFYAQTQRRTAVARELTAYSGASLFRQPDLALPLAIYAVSASRSLGGTVQPEAEQALHQAVQAPWVLFELSGHKGRVTSAAWNPQGSDLVTAGIDGTAKVWDPSNGHERFSLSGHSGPVLSVAWKPDGKQIATASSDGTIRLWDGASGTPLRTMTGEEGEAFTSVSWSSDGTRLVTASSFGGMMFRGRDRVKPASGMVRVWEADTARLLLTMPDGHVTADAVAWSPSDPNRLAGIFDDVVRVWEPGKQKSLLLQGHSGEILALAWSPDGKRLATGGEDKTAKIWDAESGETRATLMGHKAGVSAVAWSSDGKRLATTSDPFGFSRDNTAKVWDAARGLELLTVSDLVATVSKAAPDAGGRQLSTLGPSGPTSFAAWSPDDTRLATPGGVGTAKVWDVAPEELPTLAGHDARLEGVAWSPDGNRLASAGWDGMVRVWDATGGQELFAVKSDRRHVLSVAWSPDGKKIAAAGQDRVAKVWDVSTRGHPLALTGHRTDATAIAWSPDGTRLATVSLDQTAKVWDAATGRDLRTLTGHVGRVRRLAWSPDGKSLATAGDDHTIRLWNVATGEQVLKWVGHDAAVYDVAWSSDGKKLATASDDQTAKVWDARTAKNLLILAGHEHTIERIAWSPDGKRLATPSDDQTVRIWDADTGLQLLTLLGHGGPVLHVAWSPDGKRLAAASSDGQVRQYAMNIDLLMALARRRARTLTPDECLKFLHADKCPPLP